MALAPSRYELLDRIAIGGMAEVFRAKALGAHGFEKTLAIKKIIPELAKDPEFEERFIVEAKLAVDLSHANVVQVMDFGRFAGTLFIAMELVDGLDLAALLKYYRDQGEPIPIPAAFHISTEMIRGLTFAHSRNVVHRDVSPSNVLLSKAGEVKIADFGIATAMHKEISSDAGRVMGKWRYMSPEQTKGLALTESSDIFSAAIVIYEIFSGTKLFPGSSSEEIMEGIHSMPIPLLSELRPGVPDAVDKVLAKMFVRDPRKREITGAEIARELTEASYKSNIVATALDVEAAVGEACAASSETAEKTPLAFDELLRAQLGSDKARPQTERKTAVDGEDVALASTQLQKAQDLDSGTMVRSGVDASGVTVWRLDRETVAARPQSLRQSGSHPVASGEEEVPDKRYFESKTVHKSMRRGVVYAGIVFSALMAVLVFFALRTPSYEKKSVALEADAAPQPIPPVAEANLRIESTPPGATIVVNGQRQKEVTPMTLLRELDSEVKVKLFLEGHQDFEGSTVVRGDSDNLISAELVAYQAGIFVETKPSGVEVWLDGELLGSTPLERRDLRPGVGRRVELKRKDYKTISMKVDLVHNRLFEVRETLRNTLRFGYINISILNGWAEVSEKGKKKAYQKSGRYRMSVGIHRLELLNPPSGQKISVVVEVFEDRVETYKFRL